MKDILYIPRFVDTVDRMYRVRHAKEPLVVGGSDLYLVYRVPSLQEEPEMYINYSTTHNARLESVFKLEYVRYYVIF